MEDKTNIEMAIDALDDEIKGVTEYGKMAEIATCPELKNIFLSAAKDEKTHSQALLAWINAAVGKILK